MHQGIRGPRVVAAVLCGCSGLGRARRVRQQQFFLERGRGEPAQADVHGSHKIYSGNLSIAVTVDPSGSSTLSGPIKLSFGGPFQNSGAGKLPESDFTVSISALGKSGSLGILSTGDGLRHAPGRQLSAAAGDVPEARVEFSQLGAPA